MKKNYKLNLLIITIILLFLFSFNNITQNNTISKDSDLQVRSSSTNLPFIVGVAYGPDFLDPINTWYIESFNVIDQVVEGLFAYNLSDPDNALIPRLASAMGTWNLGADEYTVPLRTGVKFHDGTDFNATAVVAHWDRMAWALNTTGTNTNAKTMVETLYTFPNGTAIVRNVVDNGDNTVTFYLNGSYVPFEALLAFPASYIQSPTYTDTLTDYITASGDLVGTGLFVYDSYQFNIEVLLHAFDDYWNGKANITDLVFKVISSSTARDTALLNGDIHFLSSPSMSMLDTFKTHPNIAVLDSGETSAIMFYLGMNNKRINRTFREAISYAINYSYIIDVHREGTVDRMRSPIPQGIRYSNTTFNVPILNLTHARLVMQSMGFGIGFSLINDAEWINQESTVPFATFNFTYNIGNTYREDMLVLLQDNLAKIGIRVRDDGTTWGDFINRILYNRDTLELFEIGWGPDYNDPSNYINNLFGNSTTAFNGAQYNGSLAAIEDGRDPYALNDNVQLLMDAALSETNPVQRKKFYDRIQELLIERDFPWAWLFVPKLYHAHHVKLNGFQQNALNKLDFYSVRWEYYFFITTPDNSSSWETGTSHYIYWNSTGSITNVKIELYENDVFVAEIVTSTPNDGEFSWILSSGLADSTLYQIKITDAVNSTSYAFSDYFEIFNSIMPSPVFDGMYVNYTMSQGPISVMTNFSYSHLLGQLFNQTWVMEGGLNATWLVNTQTRIMSGGSLFSDGSHDPVWIFTNASLSDTIPISVDGIGNHLFEVSSETIYDLPGFGLVEIWVLEDLTFLGGIAWYEKSTGILLNGTFFYNLSGFDYNYTFNFIDSNVQFTYYVPPLTITTPISTSVWETGTLQSITWTSTGGITNVKIELYENDVFVMEIVASTPNDGEFPWTISLGLANSTIYQIKITDVANSSKYDYSNYFEIFTPLVIDTLTVTNPASFTAWETDTSHVITWTSTGSITNVKIELYKGGAFELEIVASTPNDGSFTWTIPTDLEDSIDYQIRISDVSNPTTYDESPNFAITSIPIPPDIPGYNLYFLVGIIFVASGILVKNRKKFRKT